MRYSKAPIIEATIDIQTTLPEDFDTTKLKEFQSVLGSDYLEANEVRTETITLDTLTGDQTRSTELLGYRFLSTSRQFIVQVRKNGFSFSILAPYENWRKYASEARRIWVQFRDQFPPETITRLGVRYINQLDIPASSIVLKDYFNTVPEIAEGIPQLVNQYFMQLVIPMEQIQAQAILNQAIVPPAIPDTTSLMFDIELFRTQEVPEEENAIWEVFDLLREGKNLIFDASLTARAKELIQ